MAKSGEQVKRVMVVTLNGDHPRTGYAARVLQNIQGLVRAGYEVSLLRLVPARHKGESWLKAIEPLGVSQYCEVPVPPVSRFSASRKLAPLIGALWIRHYRMHWHAGLVLAEGHEAAGAALYLKGHRVVVDIHGAAPEEAAYSRAKLGQTDLSIVSWFNAIEKGIVEHADRIIVVSNAMLHHLESKWGREIGDRTAVLPIALGEIFSQEGNQSLRSDWGDIRALRDANTFIYCGGLQHYQCIPEMLENFTEMHRCDPNARLLVITPDVSKFNEIVRLRCPSIASVVTAISAFPEEVPALLRLGKFGYVLREDSLINRVACPTKINEYLVAGLVIICTSGSGHGPEAIEQTGAGIVVPMRISRAEAVDISRNLLARYANRNHGKVHKYTEAYSGNDIAAIIESISA